VALPRVTPPLLWTGAAGASGHGPG